jgi:hypothetical protein
MKFEAEFLPLFGMSFVVVSLDVPTAGIEHRRRHPSRHHQLTPHPNHPKLAEKAKILSASTVDCRWLKRVRPQTDCLPCSP